MTQLEGSRIMLSQINILHCQQKELEGKDRSMIHALYILWLRKGTSQDEVTSNTEKNQAHSLIHCRVMLG